MYVYMYVRTYACMYVRTYARMHVCMCMCMCMYVYCRAKRALGICQAAPYARRTPRNTTRTQMCTLSHPIQGAWTPVAEARSRSPSYSGSKLRKTICTTRPSKPGETRCAMTCCAKPGCALRDSEPVASIATHQHMETHVRTCLVHVVCYDALCSVMMWFALKHNARV